MRRAFLVALAICALGALGYFAVERVLQLRALTAPATPKAFVQAAWTIYKHGPGHRLHVGEQGIACGECHTTAGAQGFDRPSPSACVACHEQALTIEHAQVELTADGARNDGGVAARSMSDCLTCHGFGPDPEQKAGDCMSCHSRPKHDLPAVSIHASESCTSCHDVHQNRVAPIACGECHEVQAKHGGHERVGAAQCLDCHHAHAPARSALESCTRCHGAGGSALVVAAITPAGHTCTGCHTPHTFTKSEVKSCSDCHQDVHALPGKGHQACTACHSPHDARDSVRNQDVCRQCHRDVALEHAATIAPAQACTSCHAPHAKSPQKSVAQCSSCHRDVARDEHAAHAPGVACSACHAPHDFLAPSAGHAVCASCHDARIKQLTATGHARCESCHRALPHGGLGAELPCAECHEQGENVHRGHAKCTACHDAHTGAHAAKLCESCHANQTALLSPKHGRCENCHEAHVATAPARVATCTGCHAVAKLPALHQVEQHRASCQSCHQAHPETPPSQAATCRGCHQDKADHQPEATQCSGCHPFEAPPARRAR